MKKLLLLGWVWVMSWAPWIPAGFAAEQEAKIGIMLPLSGSLAAYGKCTLAGIRMRIAEANALGGVNGVPVKLLVEDDAGDATAAINAYNKLAGSDRVLAVIGPITSTQALAIRRPAKTLKTPVISPTATNDKVTRDNEYMFRACFNDSFQGQIIANYAVKEAGTAAVLVDMNSDYSKGLAESFDNSFARAGGKIVSEEKYQQKDTEFGPQLKKIKESGAALLFIPGYPPELPLIIKQARTIGLKAHLCGADGWDNEAVINGSGDGIEGALLVGAFSPEDARPVVQKFVAAFEKGAGQRPGTFEALGYDSASLVVTALRTGLTPAALQKGLLAIQDLECVTGSIRMNAQGDPVKSAVILKIVKAGNTYTAQYVATVNP